MKELLKTILQFLLLVIIVISCNQKSTNDESGSITHDSSYAVIPHDTSNKYYISRLNFIFGENHEIASLTSEDFITIDSLFNACIIDYNDSEKDSRFKIDLSKVSYEKQIIAIINTKGEKEVWVNCLCDATNVQKITKTDWKTQIITVNDGGNCYLNFKVNLSTKKYFDLSVNGEA